MSKELALIAARNERNKKKKKEENKLQLQAPVNAITNTINKTVGKPQNKKTTVNKATTQSTTQRTQTNTLQRSSNVKEMPTFSPNDNRTVKANKKKKSVQTFDVYERGGKYFYEENGKEIPIKKSYLKNALNTNRRGVIGGFDENGNFSETNSRGVPLSQAPKEEARKYKKEARQAARDKAITDAANTIENSRIYKGLKTAGNTATNMGYGALKQGVEGTLDFAQSISDWINNSAEEKAKVALGMRTADEARREREEAERQQSEWTGKSLTDEGLKKAGWNEDLWNQWEDGSAVRRDNTAGQIAQAVGGMMPSIYAGKALGFNNTYNVPLKGLKGVELAKGIGKNVGMSLLSNAGGNAVLGASAYGNAYEEAVNNGATPEQARKYATLNAGTEFATEMVTGGIPGLKQTGILDNMADGLIDKATGKVTNKFLKQATAALLKMGYSFAGEGFEEALSDIINPMIKNATYTDGERINWKDVWRDFFIGGASGLILGGSNDVMEGINLANQQIQELNTMADQRIQQLQQEVQQDPTRAQSATQEIQDIQNYVQAQTNIIQNQAQTQAQESETTQPNAITQETQNVAKNEQNDYRGSHQIEGAKPITEVNLDEVENKIIETAGSLTKQDQNDLRKLKRILSSPDETIKIYRASPKNELNNGDWVTTDKSYAKNVADNNGGKVYEYEVKANQLHYPDDIKQLPSLHRLSSFQFTNNVQNEQRSTQESTFNNERNDYEEYQNKLKSQIEQARKTIGDEFADNLEKQRQEYNERHQLENNVYEATKSKPVDNDKINDSFFKEHTSDFDGKTGTKTQDGTITSMKLQKGDNLAKVTYTEGKDKIWIDELYVKNQNQGYGSEIVNAIKDYANKKGKYVDTFKELTSANGFWDKALDRNTNVEANQNENIPATKENVISEEITPQKEETSDSSFSNENIPDKVQNDVIAERITNNINNAIKGKNVFEEVEEATGKPIRRGIKTITTATGTTQLVSTMDDSIITYDPQSNESTLNKAREAQKGMTLDEKYQDCLDFINSDKRIKAVDIAKIELTLKELQLKGDAEKFSNLVQYAATLGTTDAQALQMMSVIKKMNPMSQLETLQKLIQKEQSKGNKIYDGVKINQELVKKVLDTQNANGEVNQDQFYEAMEDLKNDIAKQMKSTVIDKANSFRYLAMLGNPKTHIRNVVGNGFMFGLQSFKDVIGTVGEVAYDTTLKATGKEGMQERTKTFKTASKEVREYVNKKVDDFFSKNKTTNKYNESMKGLSGDLESRRNIFSNNNVIGRALNKASSINNNALDKMDKYFSTAMTKKAMKNYLTANGIRTNAQIESNPEMVARALDYALFKGKEATFHQDSKTASIIRNAREQARTGSGYTKAVGLAIDATMPFVSTPVNIAKTAMEYTPIVGLGDLNTQLKNSPKEIRGAVIIDHISKQFAGLSLLCLGMGLAASGKIKGAGEGDKEDKTEKNLGNAQYSIKFGNNTYDLSWISPSAVPLFEGVEIYNKYAKNKDVNVGAMVDTFFGALNPVTDMSVLQSIERTLTTLAYGKNAVQSLGETTFSSYLSQYIPTLSSQFAQWFDTKQRNSNTGSNALEKTFDQIKYKIPATTEFTGVGKWLNKNLTRKSLPEKVDIWGEENKNAENFWQRGFEAFLSPANRKEYKVDSTTKELERLARETDDTAVLPTSKDKSVKINGEEHELKGKDFVDLQKTYGKTAKKNLDELIKSDSYKKASDAEKKSMVGKLYDYATYKAKENYAKNKDINFDSGNQTSFAMIDAFKIPYEKYVENKVSGNESAAKILNKLNEAGFSEIQKGAVMNYYNRAYYVDEEKLYNTLKNSGLSNKQKELIKAKYKKNITDSERERYKRADNMGIDYGLYTNFRSFVSSTKGESRTGGLTKKQKVINWIQKQKLSAKQKQNLYDDYINNQRTFSYYK